MVRSISFPHMFNSASTNLVNGLEATRQNTRLVIGTERGELFGDPDFGIHLKKFIMEPNNNVFRVVLIDEIFFQLSIFMPQLIIDKKDITITYDKKNGRGKAFVTIQALNKEDFTPNSLELVLYNEK